MDRKCAEKVLNFDGLCLYGVWLPLLGPKPSPLHLTFGVALPNHRGGGISKVYSEGYLVGTPKATPYPYVIQCACGGEKAFPLVQACAALVGSPCMALLEVHREETITTYTTTAFPKERVLEVFGRYAFRLVNDGFTAFGLASEPFEVFVTDHKWLRIYCRELAEVEEVLGRFGIPKKKDVPLIGTGPHYHVPIGALADERIAQMCEPLPAEEAAELINNPDSYSSFHQPIIRQLEMFVDKRTAA